MPIPEIVGLTCLICNDTLVCIDHSTTCVGYLSPEGHDHDDNCRRHHLRCSNNHNFDYRQQNTCPACNWKGKLDCFCSKLGFTEMTPKNIEEDKQLCPWKYK